LGRHFEYSTVATAFGVREDAVAYLGTGGFGETWLVRSEDGTRSVYKIIHKDGFPAERLDREIVGLRSVDHRRVVKLLDHSVVTIDGQERPTLRFEYVEGGDLARARSGSLAPSPEEIAALLTGLLEAVHALHTARVVHRDIKPANIALRGGLLSDPVLLDLGLAKPLDMTTVTTYPAWMGTVPYMAPEQLNGQRASNAADLWSVGVVVTEIACGRHPYWTDEFAHDPQGLLSAQENYRLQLPSLISAPVVKVLDKLISFRRGQRGSARSALELLRSA
jgi:eukaryotic-like serine/threonine-protein kinase